MSEGTTSVIVPFHKNLSHLDRCLTAIRTASDTAEVIVVADGAVDDCRPVVGKHRTRLLEIPGPSGPAVARNRGAALASGNALVFVDADVEISGDAVSRLVDALNGEPRVTAVFGAYDESPAEPNFVSQYKNLAHSFIHQSSRQEACSFWAGLGAVRREAFHAVGGFDERYTRPCIEDIDLGYRLSAQGHRILLEPSIRGCHLKRWDFLSLVKTDIRDRAIPWTQLILRSSPPQNDLNLRWTDRASVVLSYTILLSAAFALASSPSYAAAALVMFGLFLGLNRGCYRFFAARRGVWFALRVIPLHFLHYLYSGLSFAIGCGLFVFSQVADSKLPGAIPRRPWKARTDSSETVASDRHR